MSGNDKDNYTKMITVRNILWLAFLDKILAMNSSTDGKVNQSLSPKNNIEVVNVTKSSCGKDEACVRFCCTVNNPCDLENHFNLSGIAEAKNLPAEYRILKGNPCGGDTFQIEGSWQFLKVIKNK